MHILSNSASESNYDRQLRYLARFFDLGKLSVNVDFEKALLNSCAKVFNKTTTCYFHYAQTIVR